MTGVLTASQINFTGGATGTNVDLSGKITALVEHFSGSLSGATGTFSGKLEAVTGAIGGFNIIDSVLKSSNNNLTLDAINALITTGSGNTRIEMGMKESAPVLQFYKDNVLQYDLGPNGITLKDGDATINGTTSSTITLNNIWKIHAVGDKLSFIYNDTTLASLSPEGLVVSGEITAHN